MTARKKATDYFTGKWFHSMDPSNPDNLGWQGQIVKSMPDCQSYMVQLFSWIDGEPTIVKRVAVGDMDGWRIYDTNKEMLSYSEYFHKHIVRQR